VVLAICPYYLFTYPLKIRKFVPKNFVHYGKWHPLDKTKWNHNKSKILHCKIKEKKVKRLNRTLQQIIKIIRCENSQDTQRSCVETTLYLSARNSSPEHVANNKKMYFYWTLDLTLSLTLWQNQNFTPLVFAKEKDENLNLKKSSGYDESDETSSTLIKELSTKVIFNLKHIFYKKTSTVKKCSWCSPDFSQMIPHQTARTTAIHQVCTFRIIPNWQ